jgi:hypothetical protein
VTRLQTGIRLQERLSRRAFEQQRREETRRLKETALLTDYVTDMHMHLLETEWQPLFATLRYGDAASDGPGPNIWPLSRRLMLC